MYVLKYPRVWIYVRTPLIPAYKLLAGVLPQSRREHSRGPLFSFLAEMCLRCYTGIQNSTEEEEGVSKGYILIE